MNYITKHDYLAAFDRIFSPLKEIFDLSLASPVLGHTAAVYSADAVRAEAFLRPLWGLVPLWRGGHGDEETKEIMRRGIIAGIDPASPHYWGTCGKCDQCYVEMAPLSCGLLLTPEVLWSPLTDREKDNLCAWMLQANDNVFPRNNWHFFRVLINLAMKHLGRAYSEERLAEDLAVIESCYVGEGWYSDGIGGQRDYYVAWAFHFYGLLYAMVENDAHAENYRARATLFAPAFLQWFSARGNALPYGRSLTYRLAQGSFFSMCLAAGIDVFDLAMMKGILSRHLDDWMSSPIFDTHGILSIGYKYPNLMMAEHYNAPGSPYWAMKFFALLALPDDHPFWQVPAAPLPALPARQLIREANMLILRHGDDAFAYVGGSMAGGAFGQMTAKYLKFVYSTRFGINLKLGDNFDIEACTDSALVFDIGGVFCDRSRNRGFTIDEEHLTIRWSPVDGIEVTTDIFPDATTHTRHHVIEADRPCVAYDCGFAVASRGEDDCIREVTAHTAEARNRFSLCRVSSPDGTPVIISASPNANIVYNKTVIPAVKYTIPCGRSEITTRIDIE